MHVESLELYAESKMDEYCFPNYPHVPFIHQRNNKQMSSITQQLYVCWNL